MAFTSLKKFVLKSNKFIGNVFKHLNTFIDKKNKRHKNAIIVNFVVHHDKTGRQVGSIRPHKMQPRRTFLASKPMSLEIFQCALPLSCTNPCKFMTPTR